jgi:hypothetical protein
MENEMGKFKRVVWLRRTYGLSWVFALRVVFVGDRIVGKEK